MTGNNANEPKASADDLMKTSPEASVELSEAQLDEASGGILIGGLSSVGQFKHATSIAQDVTVNKAKTADKAFNAMDGYIRG